MAAEMDLVRQKSAQAWCLVAKLDTQGPMSWAGQLPAGTDRDAFLSGMCQSLADQDPSQAAPLAATIGPGKIQAETFDQLAGKWVFSYDAAPEADARARPFLPVRPVRRPWPRSVRNGRAPTRLDVACRSDPFRPTARAPRLPRLMLPGLSESGPIWPPSGWIPSPRRTRATSRWRPSPANG